MLMINPDSVSPEARFLNQKALMDGADAFADICDVMEAEGQTIDDLVVNSPAVVTAATST